jgi:hypothetical protein
MAALDLYERATELRLRQSRAWLPAVRSRLARKAHDLELAARAAENAERLRRIAAFDARRRA